jgi:hypothetical protein
MHLKGELMVHASFNALIYQSNINPYAMRLSLIRNPRIYLNGFWSRGIRPKTGKDSQKVVGEKYRTSALTLAAFTMIQHLWKFTLPQEMDLLALQ